MNTIILTFLSLGFSTFSFCQTLPNMKDRVLGKPHFSNATVQDALNDFSFSNNANNYHLSKPQLKNQKIKYANTLEQKLDSMKTVGEDGTVSEKNIFKYDSNGYCIENIWYINDEEDGLVKYERYSSSYDESGNLLEYAQYHWNDSLNSWGNSYFEEYVYSNTLLIKNFHGQKQDGKIHYSSKTEYSYDMSKEVIERRYYENAAKNYDAADWKYASVDSFQYNSQNQVVKFISYKINSTFKPRSKTVYQYDETSSSTTQNNYYWNETLDSWENSGEAKWNYDKNGNLTQAMIYNTARFDFNYDENNNMLSCKEFDFNRDNGEWIQDNLYSYQYSEADNLLDYKGYESVNDNGDFDLAENITYEYDETVSNEIIASPLNLDVPLIQIDYGVGFLRVSQNYFECNDKLTKGVLKYYGGTLVEDVGEWQFYYSPFQTTGISEIQNSDFSMFPNPATESVTFDWLNNTGGLNLEIFNISGQKIIEERVTKGTPVSIKSLNEGIYIYRLSENELNIYCSGKLVVK